MEPLAFADADLERVEELINAHVDLTVLREAFAGLPALQREAVIGRVVEERSYGEIAEELSCSELVIRQRVSRGLRALRALIERN
jgi:RNA polymerase sigma-70 factor (ECF subfamily)